MTSYQKKLKAERDLWYKKYCEERQKLNIILFEPMNPLQYDIKIEYSINRDLEKAIFMGSPTFVQSHRREISDDEKGYEITFKLDPEDLKPKIYKG